MRGDVTEGNTLKHAQKYQDSDFNNNKDEQIAKDKVKVYNWVASLRLQRRGAVGRGWGQSHALAK